MRVATPESPLTAAALPVIGGAGACGSASFAQRAWSTCIDALAAISWIFFVALARPWPAGTPGPLKAAIWFLPPFLLEPVSVWLVGGTAGQMLMGLRVESLDGHPLRLPRLLFRHGLKLLLLGFSPFYIPFSSRGQAVHDHFFDTRVIDTRARRAGASLPPFERFRLREFSLAVLFALLGSFVATLIALIIFQIVLTIFAPGSVDDPDSKEFVQGAFGVLNAVLFLRLLQRRARRAARSRAHAS